ncbi:MAG: HD domain-containing protein, partial [Deltaproteobacteria bacterium]|nr:HD domain-containing protein [Deltaproteobacteria bacterium]
MAEQEPKKPQKRVASPGEKLLLNMFSLLQVVKIHQSNNKLFADNVRLFKQVLEEIWQDSGVVQFTLYRGRFFLNDSRIIYTPSMWATSAKMAEYFQARGISGLRFIDRGPLTQEQIVGFMDVFNRATKEADPTEWLENAITGNFTWVEIVKSSEKDLFSDGQIAGDGSGGGSSVFRRSEDNIGSVAKQAYSMALTAMRTLSERLSAGKSTGLQKCKRAIETLIGILFDDEISYLSLSTIRDANDQIYTHSVNVAILSMCIGKHLGLSRTSLEQLGLCGLFMDLGKIGELKELIEKPERLKGYDLKKARDHSLYSVLDIISLNASFGLKQSILAAAGEHHMGVDHSGYPVVGDEPEPISLSARILAIADQYDALTSIRPWRDPYPPHDALV